MKFEVISFLKNSNKKPIDILKNWFLKFIIKLSEQVVKMLAVVVAVFATLWLPYRALLVYNSFAENLYMELW